MFTRLKRWLRRLRQFSYLYEVRQLSRELYLRRVKEEFMEELFIQKQEKINRLLGCVQSLPATVSRTTLRPEDLRPERVIQSTEMLIAAYSADFDERQHRYEQTGKMDRQESALTKAPPSEGDDHA